MCWSSTQSSATVWGKCIRRLGAIEARCRDKRLFCLPRRSAGSCWANLPSNIKSGKKACRRCLPSFKWISTRFDIKDSEQISVFFEILLSLIRISLPDMTNDNNEYRSTTGVQAVCSSFPWQVITNDSNHQVQEWSSMVHQLVALLDKNLKEYMYRFTVDELPPLFPP